MTDTQYSMTATHMIHELQGCENEQTQSAQDTEQVVETLQSCCTKDEYWMADRGGHLCRFTKTRTVYTLHGTDYKDPHVILVPVKKS